MGLGWICAYIVTPVYFTVLVLLLYPHKSFIPYVLRFLRLSFLISTLKIRLIHLILLLVGAYFYSNFSRYWTSPPELEYITLPDRLSYAKAERDLYLSGVALASMLYALSLERVAENYCWRGRVTAK
jgi:hypothetical protein